VKRGKKGGKTKKVQGTNGKNKRSRKPKRKEGGEQRLSWVSKTSGESVEIKGKRKKALASKGESSILVYSGLWRGKRVTGKGT